MKVRSLFYIDEKYKKDIKEIHKTYHKSLSELVEEGLKVIIPKYTNKPITLKESITATYGASTTIKNMRDESNKDFVKRAKRLGL
ncbi:MAG: hypothetical protein ABH873_09775 [Candidatus Firestonebacteria bacterium]